MTPETTPKTCFFIAPIGVEGSDTRVRSDNILKFIIVPTVSACGYTAIRADEIFEPGIIPTQIFQHILEDDLVIADLTNGNPNVYYELALRHAIRKPWIQISQSEFTLPFDIAHARTILFLETEEGVDKFKQELAKQIKSIEQNPGRPFDSPISTAIDILQLRKSGNLVEERIAEILSMLQDLRGEFVRNLREQSERISELQSQSSTEIMRSTGSPISKETDWDNFIGQIGLFERTNLVELLDDLIGPNTHTYMSSTLAYRNSYTHHPYSTGFLISTELNGNYKITRDPRIDKVIIVSKSDLEPFRDYVAQRGIYGKKMGLTL